MHAEGAGGRPPTVGVLALQGSFPLHLRALERLGVGARPVARPQQLQGLDGLILPGGESTVLSLLAREYGLFEPLRELGRRGFPFFGTCAGAILLGVGDAPPRLDIVPVRFERNAYGSQLESFVRPVEIAGFERPFHGVFIRAPRCVVPPDSTARVLARVDGDAVLLEAGGALLATFHPELTDDLRLHEYFVARCSQGGAPSLSVQSTERS